MSSPASLILCPARGGSRQLLPRDDVRLARALCATHSPTDRASRQAYECPHGEIDEHDHQHQSDDRRRDRDNGQPC